MFPVVAAFLVWAFATGKYADYVALLSSSQPTADGSGQTPAVAPIAPIPAIPPIGSNNGIIQGIADWTRRLFP